MKTFNLNQPSSNSQSKNDFRDYNQNLIEDWIMSLSEESVNNNNIIKLSAAAIIENYKLYIKNTFKVMDPKIKKHLKHIENII